MTKVKELQPRQGKVELTATVTKIEPPRTFDKFGKAGRVANAKIQDDTGEVTLTLWNEQCDQIKVGDVVTIHNGWVSEYRGELQLSTGKFGSLEVGGVAVGAPAEAASSAPAAVAKAAAPLAATVKIAPKPADEDTTTDISSDIIEEDVGDDFDEE